MGLLGEFVIEKGLDFLLSKGLNIRASNPIDAAYERALKKWCRNVEAREKYSIFKFSHFEEFRKYIKEGPSICNSELKSLCELFEEELKKDDAYHYIEDIMLQAIQEGQKEIQGEVEKISCEINELSAHSQKQERLLEKIYDCVSEVRNIESTLPDAVPSIDDDYIQRKCSYAIEEKNYFDKYFHPENYPEFSLIDFVLGRAKTNNHFLLCGDAQSGKTTELRRLFHELVDSGLFRLFYQEIKGWDFDLTNLSETEQRETFMIIDALDERFDDDERNKLFNRINSFAKRNPFLKIVISCRSNFKEINQLDDFEKLYLLDIKWEESKEIIRTKSKSAEALISEIEKKELYDLTKTPLFLLTLIECFQKKNHIPDNKSELYDYIIIRQLEKEEAKGITAHPRMLKEGKIALESMAIGLQLMDKNAFSEDELLDLFDDEKQWTRIQRCGLIERENSNYSFVHNAFKEYLTSVFLDRIKSLDEIQKLCCFNGTKAIKPTWYNVIVIYLSRLSKENTLFNEIVEWLEKDNEDLLLYVDRRLIDEEKRCAIFISILKECEKRGVIYGTRNESVVEALVSFGNGEDSIDYIISELEKVAEYDTHVSNLLRCVRFIYWPSLESENSQNALKLKTLVFEVFKRFCCDRNAWAIWEPFENPYFYDHDTCETLLSSIKTSEHPDSLNSFIRFVYKAGKSNAYIDFIIEKSEFVHDYDDEGVTCAVYPIWINASLKSVDSKEGVIKVLGFLERGIKNRETRSEFVVEHKGVIDTVIAQAELLYPEEELTNTLIRIFEEGVDPITSHGEIYDFNKPIVDYLERHGLSEQLFYKYAGKIVECIQQDNLLSHKYSKCAAYFVTPERFEFFSSIYANTENGFLSVRCLNSYLFDVKVDYRRIIKEYYSKYVPSLEDRVGNKKKSNLECLFDYERFRNEVLQLLDECPGNRKELSKRLYYYDDIEKQLNKYVYDYFNLFLKNQDYEFERIAKSIADEDFYKKFVLHETIGFFLSDSEELSAQQRQVVCKIAKGFIIRFINRDEKIDRGYVYYPIELMMKGYLKDIDVPCLMELLPYSSDFVFDNVTLFQYIVEQPGVKAQTVMDFILSKINSGEKVPDFILNKWAGFIISHKIENAYPMVIEWAINDQWNDIIPMLVEDTSTISIITNKVVLNRFPIGKKLEIFWRLVIKKDYNALWVKNELEPIFDAMEDENNKIVALRMLLILGSIVGLQYITNHPEYYEKDRMLPNYGCIEALQSLFDSLDYLMERRTGCEDMRLHESKMYVISSIGRIASLSQENFSSIEHRIDELVLIDKGKYSELYYYVSQWKESLYSHNSKEWTIKDVKDLLKAYEIAS